ncbi:hypothetical protein [Actinacidiphila glaucinigra]|uniref:Hemophore-related protein n=1 Tax=Actinacidiphila glaucinigra TaxID=235986 RepID=A0A238Z9B2_9ACTN|nr:hypothetical protein [Actinacidiphila glaucinigra]SNR79578.1 hypothetical protein SAMN05216252_10178 [Actinacidiphila glaucinigra]
MALSKKLAAGTAAALAAGALAFGGTGTALADDGCHGGDAQGGSPSHCLPGGSQWSAADVQEALQSFLQAHPDIAADPHVQAFAALATQWLEAHPGMTADQLTAALGPVVSCLEAGGAPESCVTPPS